MSVDRDDLHGEAVPEWVIEAVRERHAGWLRAHPNEAPGPGLVWEWALDNCGLPAAYRRALDVIERLRSGRWTVSLVAERIGVTESCLRKTLAPNLEAWGWLAIERGPNGSREGWQWRATVPVERPPDRVATGSRSPLTPGERPGDPGRTARGPRANDPGYPGRTARQGREKGAKEAIRTRTRAVAASQLGATDDDNEFWSTIHAIEEHDGLPPMERPLRHRLARFLKNAIGRDHERVVLMLDFLAASRSPPGQLVEIAGADLGLSVAMTRRLADGFADGFDVNEVEIANDIAEAW